MPTDQTPRPGPRLETGTRTELRLTPRMALGINVLSMSRLELEQMIEVSLTENAALEDSTNNDGPADDQETTLPWASEIEISVLLNVEFT